MQLCVVPKNAVVLEMILWYNIVSVAIWKTKEAKKMRKSMDFLPFSVTFNCLLGQVLFLGLPIQSLLIQWLQHTLVLGTVKPDNNNNNKYHPVYRCSCKVVLHIHHCIECTTVEVLATAS